MGFQGPPLTASVGEPMKMIDEHAPLVPSNSRRFPNHRSNLPFRELRRVLHPPDPKTP